MYSTVPQNEYVFLSYTESLHNPKSKITGIILIYMMVLCTQVNKVYVIATLSVYPHRASLKNMPGHGGIQTYDLWNASPMLCQLSYAVRSVRVYDISELSLVPSIPM